MTKRDDSWPGFAVQVDAEALRFLDHQQQELFRWLVGYVGGALLSDGTPESDVRSILQDVFNEYRRKCSDDITDTHAFLLQRVQARVHDHRRLRGIGLTAVPEPELHLLDKIRMQETLASLAPRARRAMEILFYERGSFEDVAEEQGMSVEYVERLVARVIGQLEKGLTAPKSPRKE